MILSRDRCISWRANYCKKNAKYVWQNGMVEMTRNSTLIYGNDNDVRSMFGIINTNSKY